MNVVGDEGNNLWPIELTTDVLDHLGDVGCPNKVMVMVRAQDIQLTSWIVRDIEQSLVPKEVAIL